jgi:hypothetical protein
MSDEIDVFWQGPLRVSRAALQSALATLGFETKILSEFKEAELFWPVEFGALRTGFEVYASAFGEDLEAISKEMPELKGRDHQATFRFFGDAEGGAAFAIAAALAKLQDALVRDRHAGINIWVSSDEAVAKAQRMFRRAAVGYTPRANDLV